MLTNDKGIIDLKHYILREVCRLAWADELTPENCEKIAYEVSPGPKPPAHLSTPIGSAVGESVVAMLATGVAFALSTELSNGACPWAAGAMAAAIAAVSATWPFACTGKYRPLRVFSMLGASAFYVAVAIATSGNYDMTSYGAAFALPFFAVARVALAIRDWRKEAHK